MISLSDTIHDLAESEGLLVSSPAKNMFLLKDSARLGCAMVTVSDLELEQNKDNDEAMQLLVNSRFSSAVSTLKEGIWA